MNQTIWTFALTIAISSAAFPETEITLDAPRCGDPIRKKEVTVVDARELSGDIDAVAETIWKQIGPLSLIHFSELGTHLSRSTNKALKQAKGNAADLGCDVLVVTDREHLAALNDRPAGVVDHEEEGEVVAVYGCRWFGEVQPECPIPEEVLEQAERRPIGGGE